MLFDDFKKRLYVFADSPDDIVIKSGSLLLTVHDELIEASLSQKDGNVIVTESGLSLPAERWIARRIAKLPMLADRILNYIPDEKNYVPVTGKFFSDFDDNIVQKIENVDTFALQHLEERTPGFTSVLYLTSDAGEGKTTLIDVMARKQAEKYKKGESDWLLLPVPLGGKPFIRFDDVIVGSLVNRLRFPFLYFDAIIELAKIGYISLALDGFEEMFIVTPSGEAISALGNLLKKLDSSGNILIAARKAYFEFKSLKAQGQLFDTLSSCDVSFCKLGIDRWGQDQFVAYAKKINIFNPSALYEQISKALPPDHPLLTRAVLVKRLCKIVNDSDNAEISSRLGLTTENYFRDFIDVIIEREVEEKWLDRKGDMATPLLSKVEHYLILSMLAEEMWTSSTSSLPATVFDMIAEIVCESLNKDAITTRQVIERLKQHSLIVNSPSTRTEFQFDHEEFRWFFLGERLVSLILEGKREVVRAIFRTASLPDFVLEVVSLGLKRSSLDLNSIISFIQNVALPEGHLSFVKENAGFLLILIGNNEEHDPIDASGFLLRSDSLKGKKLSNYTFKNCVILGTSLYDTILKHCSFESCEIDSFEVYSDSTQIQDVMLKHSLPTSVILNDSDDPYYEPEKIAQILLNQGFRCQGEIVCEHPEKAENIEENSWLIISKRALRIFLRQTQLNEELLRVKLGNDGNTFITVILPELLKHGILEEIIYRGGGKQHRYKIKIKMAEFEKAYAESKGKFELFLSYFE